MSTEIQNSLTPCSAEQILARAVALGDKHAAERFAARLAPYVRRLARALVREATDAEDAAQTALLEIMQSAGNYSGRGSLESWAHRIAVRVVLRGVRKDRKRRVNEALVDEMGEFGTVERVHSNPLSDALPGELNAYLERLPDVQRRALTLRYAFGHRVPEISRLTRAPTATVKSRLLGAQDAIRKMIRQELNVREMAGLRGA